MDDKEKNLINSENSNSQDSVSSFPKHNNTFVNSSDTSDISNRINSTKGRNLQNNIESKGVDNTNFGSSEPLEKKDSLDKGNLGKNVLNSAGNALLNKASEDDSVIGDAARTVNKTRNTIKGVKATTKAVKALIAILSGPIGWGILIFGGVLLLIFLIVIVYHTIISSLSMKFNLTGKDSYEVFSEKYEEAMSRNDIDSLYEESSKDNCGEVDFFTKVKNFFGVYGFDNPQELCLYVNKKLKEKETLSGITTLSPGYFLSTLYYAYDTQNLDENGRPFIKFDLEDDEEDKEQEIEVNDLDAISTLFAAKLYTKEDLDNLIDEYILKYDLVGYGLTPYKLVIKYDEEGNETERYCDPIETKVNYETSESKFNLYLRYGSEVSESYQYDNNVIKAYDLTSSECYDNIGVAKPSLTKYDVKVDLNSDSEEIPSIDGHTYEDGFIYNTYPRYMAEYNLDGINVEFDYKVAKDIESIMDSRVSSRQDYINYLLGYPSTVKTSVLSINGSCTYKINGIEVTNLYVKLLHGANDVIPNIPANSEIEGQELVEFEKYILGVVYAESGANSDEALKAQAIAARSYAVNAGTLKKDDDGKYILEISNSTNNQTYCDPDKGCYRYYVPRHSGTVNVYTVGTEPSSDELSADAVTLYTPPLENDSHIRKAVKAVNGIFLSDSSGNAKSVNYNGDTQNSWNAMASSGSDYVEILRSTYGGEYTLSKPVCSFASGDWDSWRQGSSEWGGIMLSNESMATAGCFITAHAKAIAKSGAQVKVANFNPGTFVNIIKANGCLSGNNLITDCALKSVLVNDYEPKSSVLTGSIENKANVIAGYINNGYEVVLRVKSPDPKQHWVLVTGVSGSTIYMSDTSSDANIVVPFYNASEVVYLMAYKFDI